MMSLFGYEPGTVVGGRYAIQRVLGEGGAAVVFLARALHAGRAVALKVCREPGEAARANLLREMEALVRARHPRVVQLLGAGSIYDGRAYIATTYVAGATLRTLLCAGPLAPRDALRACTGISRAVAAMHAAGILHRDLKPENVIIPERAGRPAFARATLIDLSVFGELGQRTVTGEAQTRWGRVSGTPWYMAPEQLAGRPQTPATDVYGLGVLLYELLFGRPPMADAPVRTVTHPASGGLVAFLGPFVRRRLTEEVTLPERPGTSPALRRLVRHMLCIEPADRPASMAEVALAIRALLVADFDR